MDFLVHGCGKIILWIINLAKSGCGFDNEIS